MTWQESLFGPSVENPDYDMYTEEGPNNPKFLSEPFYIRHFVLLIVVCIIIILVVTFTVIYVVVRKNKAEPSKYAALLPKSTL